MTHRRKKCSKVILPEKDFQVDGVLCCPLPNDGNVAQLIRCGGRSHGLVGGNDAP